MLGVKQRMPRKARYPLFIIGLAVIILGSLVAYSEGARPSSIGAVVLVGFVLLTLSVAVN